MTIDFHTHAFAPKIAEKAMNKLKNSSGMFPHTDGTVDSLKELMRHDGVDLAILLPIATNPATQGHINDFAAAQRGDGVLSFGTVHPDAPDVLDELERIREMGIKGLKFHPDFQNFVVNDPKMKPIYRKISELGLITVFHSGPDYSYHPPYNCMPDTLLEAMKWFESPVVAAHWGGLDEYQNVLSTLRGIPNLYFDTACSFSTNIRTFAMELIEAFGSDHILFGSDTPWHPPEWEMSLMELLPLTEKEREAIYAGNAMKLLGLTKESCQPLLSLRQAAS